MREPPPRPDVPPPFYKDPTATQARAIVNNNNVNVKTIDRKRPPGPPLKRAFPDPESNVSAKEPKYPPPITETKKCSKLQSMCYF